MNRVARDDVLIDQNRNALTSVERPHHATDRAFAVDDRVPRALPDLFEQIVDVGVVERPGQNGNRLEEHPVRDGMQLPETEMPSDEEDAPALRVRGAHVLRAGDIDERQHPVLRKSAELEELEEQASEMDERRARNGGPFDRRARGKCGCEVLQRDSAMSSIDEVRCAAD